MGRSLIREAWGLLRGERFVALYFLRDNEPTTVAPGAEMTRRVDPPPKPVFRVTSVVESPRYWSAARQAWIREALVYGKRTGALSVTT